MKVGFETIVGDTFIFSASKKTPKIADIFGSKYSIFSQIVSLDNPKITGARNKRLGGVVSFF